MPDSRRRLARRVKSLSLDTMQKPSTLWVYRMSMASMMRAESVAFLPTVFWNCWMGMMEFFSSSSRQRPACGLVQSP